MNSEIFTETHPQWYRDVNPMHYLILGSYPPHPRKRTYPFFYPNAQNRFWKILAELAGLPLEYTRTDAQKAVEERYHIMQKLHTGVQNLGHKIQRKGQSSLDTDISITEFSDIHTLIRSHPELRRILLPGFSAESSTARLFIRYLQEQHIPFEPVIYKPGKGEAFYVQVNGKRIHCVVLNSTSTASRVPYDEVRDQFRRALDL